MELNAAKRNALRDTVFGLPSQRKYPLNDRPHAINAKARAKQQLDAGRITPAQYKTIVAHANRVEARGKP